MLDHAYVPHEFIYSKKEFLQVLQSIGMSVKDIVNVSNTYKKEPGFSGLLARREHWFFGDGAILSFIGEKLGKLKKNGVWRI